MNDDLRNKISNMPNSELVELVRRNPEDYTREAMDLANAEIEKRGIKDELIKELKNETLSSIDKKYIFKDLSTLTNTLLWLLKATILLFVVATISGLLEMKLLNDVDTGNFNSLTIEDQAMANDLRQQFIGILQLSMFLITSIVFLRWVYFSNANSRSFGTLGMKFTPGWSVGYYFVPILTLYKPYQAMKEIWRTSKDPINWEFVKTPYLLPLWWTLWLISVISGNISFRLAMSAKEINELLMSSSINLIWDLVEIPLAFVTIKLISQIYKMQNEKHLTAN